MPRGTFGGDRNLQNICYYCARLHAGSGRSREGVEVESVFHSGSSFMACIYREGLGFDALYREFNHIAGSEGCRELILLPVPPKANLPP